MTSSNSSATKKIKCEKCHKLYAEAVPQAKGYYLKVLEGGMHLAPPADKNQPFVNLVCSCGHETAYAKEIFGR